MNSNYNVVTDSTEEELQFHDFAVGANPGADNPAYTAPPVSGHDVLGTSQGDRSAMWRFSYWAQFFNVDSSDVVRRMYISVFPKDNFLDALNVNPDLWGPFWIPTSVIFAMFFTSSLSQGISAVIAGVPRDYDFTMLSFATGAVYLYVIALSTFVFFATRYFGSQPGLLEVFGIYGYSMTIWIPVSVLCVLPIDWLRWVIVSLGAVISGFFIFRGVSDIVNRSNAKLHRAIIPVILVAHVCLAVLFKFKFFNYSVSQQPEGSSTGTN